MASLLLDHNLSPRLAALLRRAGHAATTARELQLDQATDAELLRLAARAGLIVVTADADFIDLHATATIPHAGILLIPPTPQEPHTLTREIAAALDWLVSSEHELTNTLHRFRARGGWERWDDEAHGWTPL